MHLPSVEVVSLKVVVSTDDIVVSSGSVRPVVSVSSVVDCVVVTGVVCVPKITVEQVRKTLI